MFIEVIRILPNVGRSPELPELLDVGERGRFLVPFLVLLHQFPIKPSLPCQVLDLYLDRYVCAAEAWKVYSPDMLPTTSSTRVLLGLGVAVATSGGIFLQDPFGCHPRHTYWTGDCPPPNYEMQIFLMRGSQKQISIGMEHGYL